MLALFVKIRCVVAILDLGERFWKCGSQHRGLLHPRAGPKAMLGMGAGGVALGVIFEI